MKTTKFDEAIKSLNKLNNSALNLKTLDSYFEWVELHSNLIIKEQMPFTVKEKNIPRSLTIDTYNYLCKYQSNILNIYYYLNLDSNKYVRNNNVMNDQDATDIYCSLFLKPRNVVWINFGFNVGKEFGGKHPAIILKNLNNDVLIVAPVSTNINNKKSSGTVITFEANEMYSMPAYKKRFTDITRIIPVSVHRMDKNSRVGSVNSYKFNEVINKIKKYY
ncbi:MAG: type II toxin-antitoxin system PemK/MazF family toxin [Acholeplasmatales bacterium]